MDQPPSYTQASNDNMNMQYTLEQLVVVVADQEKRIKKLEKAIKQSNNNDSNGNDSLTLKINKKHKFVASTKTKKKKAGTCYCGESDCSQPPTDDEY